MSGRPSGDRLESYNPTWPAHKITLEPVLVGQGKRDVVLRDGEAVQILRIDNDTIQVGCTTVTIEALRQLLLMAEKNVLQEGKK